MRTMMYPMMNPGKARPGSLAWWRSAVLLLLVLLSLSACSEQKTSVARSYPEMDTPAAQLMLEKCSACHAAPQPSAHPAVMWPVIVERMQMQLQLRAMPPMSESDKQVIGDYLQRHANQ